MGQKIVLKNADFSENAIYQEKLESVSFFHDDANLMAANATGLYTFTGGMYDALVGKKIVGIRQVVKKGTRPSVAMQYYNVKVSDNNLSTITNETLSTTKFKERTLVYSRTVEEVQDLYDNSQDKQIITTFFDAPIIYDGEHFLAFNHNGVFGFYEYGQDDGKMVRCADNPTVDSSVFSLFTNNALAIELIYNEL